MTVNPSPIGGWNDDPSSDDGSDKTEPEAGRAPPTDKVDPFFTDLLPRGEHIPPQLSDYEILGELGRGGMGVVYKVRQKSLDRIVALKMIVGPVEGKIVERFLGEARAVAALNHPGIVPIFEIGRADNQPYYTMTFVDGGSLSAHLKKHGPMSPFRAARVVLDVARAVAHAHQNKIIHRDLKPDNVLLDGQGNPRVTDFGLAKRLGGSVDLTAPGEVVGTPSYMAPEQARGQSKILGPAVDLYALGGILYACLSGQPPFTGETQIDVMLKVTSEAPPPLRIRNPAVPADLEAICMKCLEKNPGDRYPTADALAFELAAWLGRPAAAEASPVQSPAAEKVNVLTTFEIHCPRCRETLPMAADRVGTVAKCPRCREHFVVPGEPDEAPVAAHQGDRFRRSSYWLVGIFLIAAVIFAVGAIALQTAQDVARPIVSRFQDRTREFEEILPLLQKLSEQIQRSRTAGELRTSRIQFLSESKKVPELVSRMNAQLGLLKRDREFEDSLTILQKLSAPPTRLPTPEELAKRQTQFLEESNKVQMLAARMNGYTAFREMAEAPFHLDDAFPYLHLQQDYFQFNDSPPYYRRYISIVRVAVCLLSLVLVVQAVYFYRFLYAAWSLVQDGKVRISPSMAVGGVFIPVFQLAWKFVAFRGLAVEFNRYIQRHRLKAPKAPVAWMTLFTILDVLLLPLWVAAAFLGDPAAPVGWENLILGGILPSLLFIYSVVYLIAVNALARSAAEIAEARFVAAVQK
jgi:tRNA A-37 threonylcarbamoyl transferase component Bud32/phage FluMu protein Com